MPAANAQLARAAKDYAAKSDGLNRRAWLCVSVALGTTSSVAAAWRALGVIELPDVRAAALELLDQLAAEHDAAVLDGEP